MKRLLNIRDSLSYTLRMKPLILLGLSALTACGCANLNGELPADFPPDIPIISGDIYSARSGTFEDGGGFVVDILTTLSYEEVVAFYADVVGPRGNGYVLVETTTRDTPTRYVTVAVHLGQGPYSRLPSSLIPDAVQGLHEVQNPPRDVQ